jgi:hypothetical protein
MIRVMPGGWQGLIYIGGNINPEPSDQTNLKERRRWKPKGGGGTNAEAMANLKE